MMGIRSTDIVLIPSGNFTKRALVQRDGDLVVLSDCCLYPYRMTEVETSTGYIYTCTQCSVEVTGISAGWNPIIEDATFTKLSCVLKESWQSWIEYWFGIENAEVTIS